MTYADVLSWMFQQLPMYQREGKAAYKEDLSNSLKLDSYLNWPHKSFRSIHVAGTNGKGSASHMLASVLQEAGYRVGLYTSPHLKDFRERIKINGQPISKSFVIDFVTEHKQFLQDQNLSFFEMTVGMAFDYFSRQDIDFAIIEVGLGGRLDSTNIISPILSVITNIGFDHVSILGNTLGQIAYEKAGIIKNGIPVVIGETQNETAPVFKKKAINEQAQIFFAENLELKSYASDLKGAYQEKNIRTIVASIAILRDMGFKITEAHVEKGLLHVVKNTGILGRWQILNKEPKIICDSAHNREGLELVIEQLTDETYENLHIVFGTLKDKDMDTIIDLLPHEAQYYLCRPNVERGLDVTELLKLLVKVGLKCNPYDSVQQALESAKLNASNNDIIFVGGSTFVVAEVL